MSHPHRRGPFGPIRTQLSFLELKKFFAQFGQHPSCGMCGYKFPEDATDGHHVCNPPMFQIERGEVRPMELPVGKLFSLEYTYGKNDGGDGSSVTVEDVPMKFLTLAELVEGVKGDK